MLRKNIKIAFRNVLRYKVFSFINVAGLAIGIASCILIFLFVRNELTYDAFNKNVDNIYLVQKYRHTAVGLKILDDTWIPLLQKLQDDYPGIKNGTRLFYDDEWVQTGGDRKFKESITFADPSILKVFTFPLKSGDPSTALENETSVVISEKIAKKYFGDENPIGKTLRIDFSAVYTVTGVLQKVPLNSSVSTDIIAPISSVIDESDPKVRNNWRGAFLYTFLELGKGTTKEGIESQLPSMVKSTWGEDGPNGSKQLELKLLPLRDLHNSQNQTRTFAYILICIACVILLIASVNFMNLSIARSMDRAREIGMRKVLGASKLQLIAQYLGESVFLSFLALLLAVCITEILIPVMNNLYNLNITSDYFSQPGTALALIAIAIVAGISSGIYPALVLTKFKTISSLAGNVKTSKKGVILGNALLTIQFVLSMVLLAGTGIVWDQTNYMKTHNINFNKNDIVVIPVTLKDFADRKEAANKIELFKNELLNQSGITDVTSSLSVPGDITNANVFVTPEGWSSPQPLRMRISTNDEDFFKVYGIPFIAGRDFSKDRPTDKSDAIIINESAMKDMGWTSAVGKKAKIGNKFYKIIGVVKDYSTESLKFDIRPLIHFYRTIESSASRFLSIKYSGIKPSALLSMLRRHWKTLDPARKFDYFFVDKQYDRLYASQDRMVSVVSYFSLLAIFIASMGLFGLLAFGIIQKRKEIGIRKVLGCSTPGILFLLTKKYISLILLAVLISCPLSYYLMSQWLKEFAYRVDINWAMFVAAALIEFLIAAITISFQSLRAAKNSPVKSLRYE